MCFIALLLAFACTSDETDSNNSSNGSENNDNNSNNNDDPSLISFDLYERVYGVTSEIYEDDDWVYINTNGMPDHTSPYYLGTQWESDLYEAYDG